MNHHMKVPAVKNTQIQIQSFLFRFCAIFFGVLLAHSSYAVPVVSGTTLSWPDDGWYQVQSADTFAAVCEGGTSCSVVSGTYIVINHTTGERFESIVVASNPDQPGTGVLVTGNTISWPDNGWYQVQSAENFNSMCEGGQSCVVDPGNYFVINHTTGERVEITVSGGPTVSDTPTVSGNTISWSDDGWYQVQSTADFSSVCEGGQSCTVSAGIYVVINHTSGQRYENIVVGGDNPPTPGVGDSPTVSGNLISWADDGWYQVQSLPNYTSVCEGGTSCTVSPGTYVVINLTTGQRFDNIVVESDDNPRPPTTELVSAATPPVIDGNNQVSWEFDPVDSGLVVEVQPFVEMPVASNGQPARWNALTHLGDRIFVVDEQDGKVFEITNGQPLLWFDIKSAMLAQTGRALNIDNPFHGGVRGIAFHPDFLANGKFYVTLMENRPIDLSAHTYISDTSGISADSVLVEWSVNPSTFVVNPGSYREVFRVGVPQFDHPIKQISFNPSANPGDADYGLLYIAHGDGSVESSTAGGGQANNALGKVLRINPLASGQQSYSVPSDNPFVSDSSIPDEVYSIGHRNPHHLAFTAGGQLLAAEAGRDNLDEVNLINGGADYGWSDREGAFTHLEQGTLVNGIAALPDNDAVTGYTYPVIQFGHTGSVGATFTGQALGGGYVVENGSALDGQYFYIDFVKTGRLFHSGLSTITQARTQGMPSELTVARTYSAQVVFDHDNNPSTPALDNDLRQIVTSAPGYINTNDRVDIRIGQGPGGALYLMSKRNNMIYQVSNSVPSPVDPSRPVGTGRPSNNLGTHGFFNWDLMTADAQSATPSDCLLGAAGSPEFSPVYCFSPYDRRLMRIEHTGEIRWQFPLPGENSTNHIESINFVNAYTVATIADATPSFDDSAFDMSLFEQTGAYIGTVPVLQDIENPAGEPFAGVNLDGLDLLVRTGPLRRNPVASVGSSQEYLNDIYVFGEYYSEIIGGDPTRLDGWRNEGAFREKLDSVTGETLHTLLFPGQAAEAILISCAAPQDLGQGADSCN